MKNFTQLVMEEPCRGEGTEIQAWQLENMYIRLEAERASLYLNEHWRKLKIPLLLKETTFPFKVEEVNQLTQAQHRDVLLVKLRGNFLRAWDQLGEQENSHRRTTNFQMGYQVSLNLITAEPTQLFKSPCWRKPKAQPLPQCYQIKQLNIQPVELVDIKENYAGKLEVLIKWFYSPDWENS